MRQICSEVWDLRTRSEIRVLPPSRRQKFGSDDLFDYQCICPQPASSEIKQPFNDDASNLLAKGIVGTTDRDTEFNFCHRMRCFEEPGDVTADVDNLPARIVNRVRKDACRLLVMASGLGYKLYDLIK